MHYSNSSFILGYQKKKPPTYNCYVLSVTTSAGGAPGTKGIGSKNRRVLGKCKNKAFNKETPKSQGHKLVGKH